GVHRLPRVDRVAPAASAWGRQTRPSARVVRTVDRKGARRLLAERNMIVLYNPLSTTPGKQPLPLSLMSLAAVLESRSIPWTLVDGNITSDPARAIVEQLSDARRSAGAMLAVTVMPGPQLTQAVDVCRRVKAALPHLPIVWGGYFPTQHAPTVLRSSYVDFVVRSQGEQALLQLYDLLFGALRSGGSLHRVAGLSWKAGAESIHNPTGAMTP